MESKAVDLVSADPGWKIFSSRFLGVEVKFQVPEAWIDTSDAVMAKIDFIKEFHATVEQYPFLSIQRLDIPAESTLKDFTSYQIESHKAKTSGNELNVIDTTLGGYEAGKVVYTEQIAESGKEDTLFQVWTKVHKYIFLLSFLCADMSQYEKFKKDCSGVLKNFTFGAFHQEHVLMKTNQLRSGFTVNSPVTWLMEEETLGDGKMESKIFYRDETGILKSQAKLTTTLGDTRSLSELRTDLNDILKTVIYQDTTIISESLSTVGASNLECYKVEFNVNNCDYLPPKGMLCLITHQGYEWFSGTAILSYLFYRDEKQVATYDLCIRSAASLELPIDPLDEDDRNLDLHTYENLNLGFRLKFNKNKFKPKVVGSTVKMLPTRTDLRMVTWPVPEISGTVSAQVNKVSVIDDFTVDEFVSEFKENVAKDPEAVILESAKIVIDDTDAMKLVFLNKKFDVRLTMFVYRKSQYWVLLSYFAYNGDRGDEVYVKEIVNNFKLL